MVLEPYSNYFYDHFIKLFVSFLFLQAKTLTPDIMLALRKLWILQLSEHFGCCVGRNRIAFLLIEKSSSPLIGSLSVIFSNFLKICDWPLNSPFEFFLIPLAGQFGLFWWEYLFSALGKVSDLTPKSRAVKYCLYLLARFCTLDEPFWASKKCVQWSSLAYTAIYWLLISARYLHHQYIFLF